MAVWGIKWEIYHSDDKEDKLWGELLGSHDHRDDCFLSRDDRGIYQYIPILLMMLPIPTPLIRKRNDVTNSLTI